MLTVSNRRFRDRVNQQVQVLCQHTPGYTLNVSLRGARIVLRQHARRRFLLRLELDGQPIEVCAERVWEESLGGGNQVIGVRFLPAPEQMAALQGWMDRQAC